MKKPQPPLIYSTSSATGKAFESALLFDFAALPSKSGIWTLFV